MLFKAPYMILRASTYSLRLPYEYLIAQDSYNNLSELLRIHAPTLPFKLIIEMPDRLVREDSVQIKQYIKLFRKYNIDIGIFEFIGDSEDYQYLQDLRPVYIKGEGSYFLTQNTQSLSALRLITDSVDISLIAVGVMEMEMVEMLEEKGIHIVQGRVTEMLEV
jgi:EAL domain-containing protein (putative c-di-GMP-specific phosphodiesterase class I)